MACIQMRQLIVKKQMMEYGLVTKFDGDLDPLQLLCVVEIAQGNMSIESGGT